MLLLTLVEQSTDATAAATVFAVAALTTAQAALVLGAALDLRHIDLTAGTGTAAARATRAAQGAASQRVKIHEMELVVRIAPACSAQARLDGCRA